MMLMKRSRMWRSIAIAALFLVSTAFAKENKKKDAEPDHKGGMMEEGGKDPAETETLDEDGQFVPGKKKVQPAGEGGQEGDEGEAGAGAEGKQAGKGKAPEAEKKKPIKVRKTIGIFGEALIGFGKAPEPGPNNATTGGATSFGFLVGGHYDVTTEFRLMLRVPWTTATIKDSAGNDKSAAALGLPEIAARYRLTDPGSAEWAIRLAVGIPVAQGNPDVTNTDAGGREQARVQRVADAANGWHDPELYSPKRVPISPALLFTSRQDKLRLGAELKAIFLPKVGGSIAVPTAFAPGTVELNSFGFVALLGGSASYEVLEHKLFLALAAWATYQSPPLANHPSSATPPPPFQFVLEPKILAQFGRIVPSVGFVAPVGGQLGGNIYGLRIHIDAVF
jgi:hypothetical protein